MESANLLKTVDKALRLLEVLHQENREVGIADIAKILEINRTTTFKLLRTLQEHRFVEQNPQSKKYRLGYRILEIGSDQIESIDLRHHARPLLTQLRDELNETVNLMIFDDCDGPDKGMYIDILQSRQSLRMVCSVGSREQLHYSAVGKAIMAFLPEMKVDEIVRLYGLCGRTQNTITDPAVLKSQLAQIKAKRYAIDNEEGELGIRCVGAPIFDHYGQVIGSLSVAAPANRLSISKCQQISMRVIEVAIRISQLMGVTSEP